jgi:hypothetical protein
MPSLLTSAAMAALAGSKGRSLGQSGDTMCGHDACGRKLLVMSSTHGDPVFLENYAAGTALAHGDVFFGYEETSVAIDGGKITVTAHMKSEYSVDDRACTLKVTPSVLADSSTSATFNPNTYTNDADIEALYATVESKTSNVLDKDNKLTVTLKDPSIAKNSLGFLGVELDIVLDCKDDKLVRKDFPLFQTINGQTKQKVKVKHTFQQSNSDQLPYLGQVDTLKTETKDGFAARQKMQVAVQGSASRKLEDSVVRFPKGEWTTFSSGSTLDKSQYKVQCTLEQIVKSSYESLAGWYRKPFDIDILDYDGGRDTQCDNNVCTGRQHDATISFTTDVGFEIPLSKYFDAQPTIECHDGDDSKTVSKSVTLAQVQENGRVKCGTRLCQLANINVGLVFESSVLRTENFGDDKYGTSAHVNAFGNDKFFTVTAGKSKAWADLDETYDYGFTITSTARQCENFVCSDKWETKGSSSPKDEFTKVASAKLIESADSVDAVDSKLADILTGIQSNTKINRPTKYGETRHEYKVKQSDDTTAVQKSIALRRASSNIRVNLAHQGSKSGTVKYVEDAKQSDIVFDGPDLPWRSNLGSALLDTDVSSSTAKSDALVLDATIGHDASTNIFTFFKTQVNVGDANLFSQLEHKDGTACPDATWCKSLQGGKRWLCSLQTSSYTLRVGKDSKDSRQANVETVTMKYDVAASVAQGGGNTPADPSATDSNSIKYQLAGAAYTTSLNHVAKSDDLDDTDVLSFNLDADTRILGYNCDSPAQFVTYKATYSRVCSGNDISIPYRVPHSIVYSDTQVKPSNAKATTTGITEHALQEGTDITFQVFASTAAARMPFDDGLQIDVTLPDNSFKTLTVQGGDCSIVSEGASAMCTIEKYRYAAYDTTHQLGDNEDCEPDASHAKACPKFGLVVKQKLTVPDLPDDLADMFKPADVPSNHKCGDGKILYKIGEQSFFQPLKGSEQLFSSSIQFFNNGYEAAFATIGEDLGATGNTGEYTSTVGIRADRPIPNLNGDLTEVQLKMRLSRQHSVPIKISNAGGGDAPYEAHICDNPSTFAACHAPQFGSVIKAMNTSNIMDLAVKISTKNRKDPCDGILLGKTAYDFKFSIQEADDGFTLGDANSYTFNTKPAHEYTLPFICHKESNVVVKSVSVRETTTGWNDRVVEVQLSGSAINADNKVTLASGELLQKLRAEHSVLEAAINATTLKAHLELDFIPDKACDATSGQLNLGDAALTGQELSIACPTEKFSVRLNGAEIVDNKLLSSSEYTSFGDILKLEMLISGREKDARSTPISISSLGDGGRATFVGGDETLAIADYVDESTENTHVYIQILPEKTNDRVNCTFLQIILSAPTIKDRLPAASTKFRVRCPRQNLKVVASDEVHLEFGVNELSFGHSESSITVAADPNAWIGEQSTLVLGRCVDKTATVPDGVTDSTCDMTKPSTVYQEAASLTMQRFKTCGGTFKRDVNGQMTASVNVARSYHRNAELEKFAAVSFCRETTLSVTVQKTATSEITIAVADTALEDMKFDVHVTAAEWVSCPDGKYKLKTDVEMARQIGDESWTQEDIESYSRKSTTFTSFKNTNGASLDDDYTVGGAKLTAETACIEPDSAVEHRLSFTMKVTKSNIDYFSAASVAMTVSAPKAADIKYADNLQDFEKSLDVEMLCAATTEFIGDETCLDQNSIPSSFSLQLKLSIGDAGFDHEVSPPQLKTKDEDCTLHEDCPLITSFMKVGEDNVGDTPFVSQNFKVATFKALRLAGRGSVSIGWTVTRKAKTTGRRLRMLEHVSYTLGADGSVSKSTSFAVAPAVRESDGASVITTKEHITDQKLDANGTADGDATVIERTIVEEEKTGEDHTLAILGIVFGGLGAAAAIAVALFVGCASRKDAQGVGSSFSTVSGGFSDRQPLFNRNRFAPSDF